MNMKKKKGMSSGSVGRVRGASLFQWVRTHLYVYNIQCTIKFIIHRKKDDDGDDMPESVVRSTLGNKKNS